MNQERPMEEPGNTPDKTSPGKVVSTLGKPWLFYSLFCLGTTNSSSSDFWTVSNLASCMSVPFKARNRHSKHAQCPELAGDREIYRAICWTQDPLQAVAQFHSPEQILLPSASQSPFCLVWDITVALLPLVLNSLQVVWWGRPSPAAAAEGLKALRAPVFL